MRKAAKRIADGEDIEDIVHEYPGLVAQYGKGFEAVKRYRNKRRGIRPLPPRVYCLFGPTGCAKTFYAYHWAGYEVGKLWTKTIGDGLSKKGDDGWWFDGYNGQRVVLFDEFKDWCGITSLLQLLHQFPVCLPVKCSTINCWDPCVVVITSNARISTDPCGLFFSRTGEAHGRGTEDPCNLKMLWTHANHPDCPA